MQRFSDGCPHCHQSESELEHRRTCRDMFFGGMLGADSCILQDNWMLHGEDCGVDVSILRSPESELDQLSANSQLRSKGL